MSKGIRVTSINELFRGRRSQILLSSLGVKVGIVRLRPGEEIGKHGTGKFEELLFIVKGNGRVETEGGGRKFKGGDVVRIESEAHNVINEGKEELIYVYAVRKITG